MAFFIQKAAQGVAAGIGVASEARHEHKEKKRAEKLREAGLEASTIGSTSKDIGASSKELLGHYDAAWELDDAQDEILESRLPSEKPLAEGKGIENPMKIADAFMQKHPAPQWRSEDAMPHLPLPVVLPQKRPESRVRGFIRAYAPLLEDSCIDQATFLEFIHDLNMVCLPNPWIQAINLASFVTMALPTVTGLIVSRIINKVTAAASEAHSRSK